ncbi:MAG TPA: hypothetical protein VGD74_11585 [Vulgatibacter sp.]
MSGVLFVPQALMDEWLQDGLADLTMEGLKVPAVDAILPVEAAYRFTGLLDGGDDAGLLEKVKSEQQLRDLGAEPYGDSVLLGEVAYQVEPGFVARTPAAGAREWRKGGGALLHSGAGGTPPGPNGSAEDEDEGAERLSQFFG